MAGETYNWKREFQRLWDELVPPSGQAATVQGELIRIVGKLTDQAYRNGNGNWDSNHEKMWRFVASTIASWDGFTPAEQQLIHEKVNEIIRDRDCPDLSGDGSPYYFISEMVVKWCMGHTELIPHCIDPLLRG